MRMAQVRFRCATVWYPATVTSSPRPSVSGQNPVFEYSPDLGFAQYAISGEWPAGWRVPVLDAARRMDRLLLAAHLGRGDGRHGRRGGGRARQSGAGLVPVGHLG